jgi:hypothetical protein
MRVSGCFRLLLSVCLYLQARLRTIPLLKEQKKNVVSTVHHKSGLARDPNERRINSDRKLSRAQIASLTGGAGDPKSNVLPLKYKRG